MTERERELCRSSYAAQMESLGYGPDGTPKDKKTAWPDWISVKDRLPEEGEEVLVWNDEGFCYVDEIKNGIWRIPGAYSGNTHWMPLPEPPKEET